MSDCANNTERKGRRGRRHNRSRCRHGRQFDRNNLTASGSEADAFSASGSQSQNQSSSSNGTPSPADDRTRHVRHSGHNAKSNTEPGTSGNNAATGCRKSGNCQSGDFGKKNSLFVEQNGFKAKSGCRKGRFKQYTGQSAGRQHRNDGSKEPHGSRSRKGTDVGGATNRDDDDELDIPGFYYDKEKKRYFKIAPNHSINSITRDSIAKKEAETQRQKDLNSIMKGRTASCQPSPNLSSTHRTNNVVTLLRNRSIMDKPNSQSFQTQLLTTTVSRLKPAGSQFVFNREQPGMYDNLEHMQLLRVGTQHDEILALWSLKETWVQRIQMLHLEEKARTSEHPAAISVQASPHHKVIIQSLNKVTDMCWAPMRGQEDRRHILYTTICHTGNLYSLAMIRSMNSDEQPGPPTFLDYNLGKKATWTCAWNQHRQQFSVGSEKCALMLNVERRTMWEYNTRNSDPLSQVFSHQNGCYFHTGTRKGQILTYDLRGRSTFPISTLQHKSSVCGLTLLQNDTHLLASDFSGKICLWDVRNQSAVVEYCGNVNQYTKLPVHVDETENIVYTAGEDGYTRFWTLQQGTPLHTIPPPCAVSRETIPSVQLSLRWGNRQGNAGLIMGLENKLYYYGALPLS